MPISNVPLPARSSRRLIRVARKPLPAISMKMATSRLRTGWTAGVHPPARSSRAPARLGQAPTAQLVFDQRLVQRANGLLEVSRIDDELHVDIADLVLHRDHLDPRFGKRAQRRGHQPGFGDVAADHRHHRHRAGK